MNNGEEDGGEKKKKLQLTGKTANRFVFFSCDRFLGQWQYQKINFAMKSFFNNFQVLETVKSFLQSGSHF